MVAGAAIPLMLVLVTIDDEDKDNGRGTTCIGVIRFRNKEDHRHGGADKQTGQKTNYSGDV